MRLKTVISMLALGTLTSAALAQDDSWGSLEAVDQGSADVGPLSESLRLVPIDMRASDSFERVFRLEGVDGAQDQFARRSGAITAVFSQSVYLPSQFGGGVAIPAGTVFYIGDPPDWMRQRYNLGTLDASEPADFFGRSQSTRIETGLSTGAIDTSAPTPQIVRSAEPVAHEGERAQRQSTPWRSEGRRARRVSSLLSLAAAGE